MKLKVLIKSLALAVLLSQSTAQGFGLKDVGTFISNLWDDNKTIIVGAGVLAATIGGAIWANSQLNKIKNGSKALTYDRNPNQALIFCAPGISKAIQTAQSNCATSLKPKECSPKLKYDEHSPEMQQKEFMEKFFDRQSLQHFEGNELKAAAEKFVFNLTQFCEEQNKLKESQMKFDVLEKNTIGLASIVNMTVGWITEPQTTTIADGAYKALVIDHNCYVYTSAEHMKNVNECEPIVHITTANHDEILITKVGRRRFRDSFDLYRYICKVDAGTIKRTSREATGKAIATIPLIDLSQQASMSWLVGAKCGSHEIAQAKQYVTFKMGTDEATKKLRPFAPRERDGENEKRETVNIDDDCILWVKGRGAVKPIFAALIPRECWQAA